MEGDETGENEEEEEEEEEVIETKVGNMDD